MKSLRPLLSALLVIALSAGAFPVKAQDPVVSPAQDDLVSSAYGELRERGLEPLTKLSSFYILAILNDNTTKPFSLIKTSDELRKHLAESPEIRNIVDITKGTSAIDLVGYRFYSTTVVTLVDLITTPKGPLCIRMNLYTSGKVVSLQSLSITTSWLEMDDIMDRVTQLPATLNLQLKLEELQAAN